MSTLDCLIAGGGAAGCYAAITAARRGRRVGIVEHNPRGSWEKKAADHREGTLQRDQQL